MGKIKQISILGFADATREDPLYKEAYEAAQVLAQAGFVIINGGGPGVMRAASEGAKAVGGPGNWRDVLSRRPFRV